jgi:hypothetical protein
MTMNDGFQANPRQQLDEQRLKRALRQLAQFTGPLAPANTRAWLNLDPLHACGGELDLRPDDFQEWWGANQDALIEKVNDEMRPGCDLGLAPAHTLDKLSMLAHNIALCGWQASLAGADLRAFRASELQAAEAKALAGTFIEIAARESSLRAFGRHHGIRLIEIVAASTGLAGAALLAFNGNHAGWGWVAYLASNAGWIAFAALRGHRFLLAQQVGFTATSILGIAKWLL